jgi:hypothetical protein
MSKTRILKGTHHETGWCNYNHIGTNNGGLDSITICGLGEDSEVHFTSAEFGEVVDCPACKSMWKACQTISPKNVAGMDTLSDDDQEPVLITCERCGRKTSHPEGWHYCHAREVKRENN